MSLQEGPVAERVATPSEARACPRCASPLGPGQEWCLNCGAAATTRIAAAPTWRGPLAAMIGVGLLALAALALAFFALADDDPAPAPTPTPTPFLEEPELTPSPDGTATPGSGTPTPTPAAGAATPAPTAAPAPAGTGSPADWPAGRDAWTIVLHSTASRAAAVRRAQRLTAEGVVVGVLASDDFRDLDPGRHLVFSGQYDSAREAARAQRALGSAAPASAFVRRITPR
jgi:hypothetical protein